jgi:hypothetical protein
VRRRDRLFMMRSYWSIGLVLSAVMALFLATGLDVFAMLLFQMPIAYFWLSRNEKAAAGMLLCAVVVPILVTGSLAYGLVFGVIASYGLLLGVLARRQVSLGVSITVVTVAVFAFLAMLSATNWEALNADLQAAFQEYAETLESDSSEDAAEQVETITEVFGWIKDHLPYLYFGALLSSVALLVTAMSVPVYWRYGVRMPLSAANWRFMWMRTPELLVWVAIGLAGLWFLDSRWPNDAVRFVAWNGSLALATVYWINGLSILFYVAHVWKWRPAVLYMLLAAMFLLNVIFTLSIFGFFDTWTDFRRKITPVKVPEPPDDESGSGQSIN